MLAVIVFAGLLLLAWEVFATRFDLPVITDLSHTWPWSILIWGYVIWLVTHLVNAGVQQQLPLQVGVYALYLIGSVTWLLATAVLLGRELGWWS